MWTDTLKIVLQNSYWLLPVIITTKVRLVQKIDTGHVYAMKSSQNGKKRQKYQISQNYWLLQLMSGPFF